MTNAPPSGREARDVILRDGSTLRLEAPGPHSTAELVRFLRAASAESLHSRFREMVKVDAQLAERFIGDR